MRRSKLIITGIVLLMICVLSFLTAREKSISQARKKVERMQPEKSAAQQITSQNRQGSVTATAAIEKKQRAVKPRVKIDKDLKTATLK